MIMVMGGVMQELELVISVKCWKGYNTGCVIHLASINLEALDSGDDGIIPRFRASLAAVAEMKL